MDGGAVTECAACCEFHRFTVTVSSQQFPFYALVLCVVLLLSMIVLISRLNRAYKRTVDQQRAPLDRLLDVTSPRSRQDTTSPAVALSPVSAAGSDDPRSALLDKRESKRVRDARAPDAVTIMPVYYTFSQTVVLLILFQIFIYLPEPTPLIRELRFLSFALCTWCDNFPIFYLIRRGDRAGRGATAALACCTLVATSFLVYTWVLPTADDCSWCGVHFPKPGIEIPYYTASATYILFAILARRRERTCGFVFRRAMWPWCVAMSIPYGVSAFGITILQYWGLDAGYCIIDFCAFVYSVVYAPTLYRVFVDDSRYCARMDTVKMLAGLAGRGTMEGEGSSDSEAGLGADLDSYELIMRTGSGDSPAGRAVPRSRATMKKSSTGVNVASTDGYGGAGGDSSRSELSAEIQALLTDSSIYYIRHEELTLGRKIGSGGYGAVCAARWRGVDVAVKSLYSLGGTGSSALEGLGDFLREVAILSRLRHPHVVMLLGVCVDAGHQAIVTEFMKRGSLCEVLHSNSERSKEATDAVDRVIKATRGRGSGSGEGGSDSDDADLIDVEVCRIVVPARLASGATLSWEHKLKALEGCVKGMRFLHGCTPRVLHRDLKSPNILISDDWSVKLCDFGLARVKAATQTMTAIGTCQWTAPEVLRRDRYSEKADVWAAGVVMWELATEALPYGTLGVVRIAHQVAYAKMTLEPPTGCPKTLAELMKRCMSPRPRDRPTFAEIDGLLATIREEGPDAPGKSPGVAPIPAFGGSAGSST